MAIRKKYDTFTLAFFFAVLFVFNSASHADNLQDEFTAGLEALDNDRLKTAREIFHGILSTSPGLHRARLELARAYYMSMDYEEARAQAQQVLDDPNTPGTVRATVLAFIAQIDKDAESRTQRHQWTPSIYLGLMQDSNVNVGPESESIVFQNQPRTINQEALEKDDTAFVIIPSIAHTYNPGRRFDAGEHSGYLLWQSQASYYYRDYFSEDDFNLSVLNVSTGPAWIVPRHWRAGIDVSLDQLWYGGSPLALFSSINPNITWQLGDNSEFTLNGTLGKRDYNKSSDRVREGTYRSLGGSFGHYMNDRKVAFNVGGRVFDFDAEGDRYSNDGWEAFLSGIVKAWPNGSVYARAGYQTFDFEGQEPPPFAISREDDESRYTIGFQHDYKAGLLNKWTLSGSWNRTENESNIPINDFNRNQFNLGLSRSF